jgi:hypothetical protein
MKEVDVQPLDARLELAKGVKGGLACPPVIALFPAAAEVPHVG